jgi:hypothetical protein
MNQPILVTGIHRSATSWIGRMLAAGGGLTYANEPLSVSHRQGVLGVEVKHWYLYINEENEAQYLPALQDLAGLRYQFIKELRTIHSRKDVLRMGRDYFNFTYGRLRGHHVLYKDPFALFSASWFAQRLNCKVVISVRHPCGFASSLKRLNWPFELHDLLDQPMLMRDYLEPDRAEMEAMPADDIIGQSALLWRMIYRTVHATHELFPDFKIVRHEDLSLDPVAGYKSLYKSLGLTFDEKVHDAILNTSSSENPSRLAKNKTHSVKLDSRANLDNWKKILTTEEITRIRKMTEGVSHLFYSDNEW